MDNLSKACHRNATQQDPRGFTIPRRIISEKKHIITFFIDFVRKFGAKPNPAKTRRSNTNSVELSLRSLYEGLRRKSLICIK